MADSRVRKRIISKRDFNKNVVDKTDKELENDAMYDENISIAMLIFIICFCFIVGILLGYLLFRIAINNSNIALILKYYL